MKSDELKNVIKNTSGLLLVDFYADWCGPCKVINPMFAKVKNKLTVVKINADTDQKLLEEYHVSALPTLMFYKNGQLVDKTVGVPGGSFERKIDSLL